MSKLGNYYNIKNISYGKEYKHIRLLINYI